MVVLLVVVVLVLIVCVGSDDKGEFDDGGDWGVFLVIISDVDWKLVVDIFG